MYTKKKIAERKDPVQKKRKKTKRFGEIC